ncbi:unnamed protein product [Allacma fusca]|uniref:AAA+ ATPase domain-containing protein n=1 Tax=Allacma fusca TaxID=39272 RepID=A0A8J2K859_9HEXA|nr:unnamed protein product [Allacma fusca]
MSVMVTVNLPKSNERPKRIEFNIDDSVPTFTGREDFIKDLHEEILNNQKNKPQSARSQAVVISGMAGVGKTQLVRKYIELYKNSYEHVIWINAETYSVAISCFLRIASKISIDLNYDGRRRLDEDILDEIWNFVCQKSTLIVYDNVEIFTAEEGKNGLQQLLPQINSAWKVPAIIVTTRNRNWETFTFRDLRGFDENESWELLSKQDFQDNEDNRYLVKELQNLCEGLPLGVQQAISFIRHKRKICAVTSKGPYTARDFMNEVSVNRRKFLSTEPPEFVSKNLYVLLDMTFKQMETIEHGELALRCLELMAILSPDNIPTVLINEFFKDEGNNLGEALMLLHDRNLITSCNEFYQIHRMIQAISLESSKIDAKKVESLISEVIEFFTKFLEALAINSGQVLEIINNAVIIHQQIAPDTHSEEIGKFQTVLYLKLGQIGCYKIALTICQELLKTNEKLWGEDDDRTINLKEDMCFAFLNAGSYDQSEKLFNEVLQKRNTIFGPQHPTSLNTKQHLAESLDSQGKCEEAHQIYKDILEIRTRILGPEHRDTLDIQSNIAGVLKSKGRYKEAYVMYMDILEIQNKIFGPKNPGTLSTKENLAYVLMLEEKNEEAYLIYTDILEINSAIFGTEHTNTIRAKQKIARVLDNQRKYEEAHVIYNEILEVHKRIYGPEHPKTLSTKHDMAEILKSQEMYDEAIQIYTEIIKTQSKILGPDHPDTLHTRHYMAGAFKYQDKYEEAYQIYKDILEIRNAVLGPEHPSTLHSKHSVADVLESLKRYREAYQIYNEVLKSRNAVLGPEHHYTLSTKSHVADVLVHQEKYEEAFEIYSEILEIQNEIIGPDHPDTLVTNYKVAGVWEILEKYEEAFKIYNESVGRPSEMENNISNSWRSTKNDSTITSNTKNPVQHPKSTISTSTGLIINGIYHGDMEVLVNLNIPNPTQRPKRLEFNIDECVPTFTGRDAFVKQIHEDILNSLKREPPSSCSQVVVLCGMAGVGKSELARKYIELYKKQYDHVLWINAENYSVAMTCLLRIASKISIDFNHDGRRKLDEDILDEIYEFVCQKYTLIVYDNVEFFKEEDGQDGLHLLLPKVKTTRTVPAIIVTTRNPNWGSLTCRDLKGFDINETWELLSKQDFEDNEDNQCLAEGIQNMCNGLPLEVQQAISLFRHKAKINAATSQKPYTAKDFLSDLSLNRKKLLPSTEPADFVSKNLYALVEMTFELIDSVQYGELALQCLSLMVILSPDHIPTCIIDEFFKDEAATLTEALSLLHDCNIVTRSNECYQINRNIQTVLVGSSRFQNYYTHKKEDLMSKVIPFFSGFLDAMAINSVQVHEITNSAVQLHKHISPESVSKDILDFQKILLHKLTEIGKYNDALTICHAALKTSEILMGEEGNVTIDFKESLCEALLNAGKYPESQNLFSEVLHTRIDIFGPEHPATLTTKNNLGEVLHTQGKYEEAYKTFRDVLEIRQTLLGPEHLVTLATKRNLAGVLESLGKFEDAYQIYIAIRDVQVPILKHPDTLTTKSNLAKVLHTQGKYEEAHQIYKDILKCRNAILGPEHPSTLLTRNNIAFVLESQGRFEEAYQIYIDIQEIQISKLGAKHPQTLTTLHNIANVLESQGKFDEAYPIYVDVLESQNKILGPEHPQTLKTKHNMASVLLNQCKFEDAYAIYDNILKIKSKLFGLEHPSTISTKQNLACVLQNQGKYEEAQQINNDVLESQKKILGPVHPNILIIKQNIAFVLELQEKFEEARPIYNDVLQSCGTVLGPETPSMLTTKLIIANAFKRHGKYDEENSNVADLMNNDVLVNRKTEYTPTLTTKFKISEAAECPRRCESPIPIYNQVPPTENEILIPDHPDGIITNHDVAGAPEHQGNYKEQNQNNGDILKCLNPISSPEHPTTSTTEHSTSGALECKKNYGETLQIYDEVLNIENEISGTDQPEKLDFFPKCCYCNII